MNIEEQIREHIKSEVKECIQETFEPLVMLKGFENVDVLTFDEVAKALRLTADELENAIKTETVPCVKPGKPRSTWRFPKRLLIDFLLGQWKPKENKKVKYQTQNEFTKMALELRG